MIKSMVIGFVSLGVDATLSANGCGIWEHLYSFSEVKCLQSYFKTLWMRTCIYKDSRQVVNVARDCECKIESFGS